LPPRFVARQLSRPTGVVGRLVGWLMNRTNAAMNVFAVQQLDLQPTDRVLEIGFGGGVTLPSLLKASSFVGGVDRSADVISRTKARFANAVRAGRADFRVGTVEALPFEAGSFNKVCTVNTVYFWTSLKQALRKSIACCRRVAASWLASYPRSGWTEWTCRRTYSRPAHPTASLPRLARRASEMSAANAPRLKPHGSSSSPLVDLE